MINVYESILPLEETKNYLRIDDCFNEDDSAINRMIASAFGYIEKQTNHVFRVQDKTYNALQNYGCYNDINIFDYPINTVDFPDDVHPLYYSGFVKFVGNASVTLNVGYASREIVPSELIDCALMIIERLYYGAEKSMDEKQLPFICKQIIDTNRRFIAI